MGNLNFSGIFETLPILLYYWLIETQWKNPIMMNHKSVLTDETDRILLFRLKVDSFANNYNRYK